MLTTTIEGRNYAVPESWNEISLKHLYAFIQLVYLQKRAIFRDYLNDDGEERLSIKNWDEYHKARAGLLYFLLGCTRFKFWVEWKWKFIPVLRWVRLFDLFDSHQLHDMLVRDKIGDFFFTSLELKKNLLPVITPYRGVKALTGEKYYGPLNFDNLVALEYSFADVYYVRFKKNPKNIKHLDTLIAILYRARKPNYNPDSPDTDGDPRERFNRITVDKRVELFAKLPVNVKYAILIWYESCRSQLPKKYPHVFTKETREKKKKGATMIDILLELAGDKFGTVNETHYAPIELILMEMESLQIKAEEMNKKLKKRS